MKYYLRKNVKLIEKGWRFVYFKGVKFEQIPEDPLKDKRIIEFARIWGDGPYGFIGTGKGRKVVNRFKVTTLGFRAMVDSDGKPIRPLPQTQRKKLSRPVTNQNGHKPRFKQAITSQPSVKKKTKPQHREITPRSHRSKTSPRSASKQRTAPALQPMQTRPSQPSMQPSVPLNPEPPPTQPPPQQTKSIIKQNLSTQQNVQTQPVQTPMESTSITHEESQTVRPKKASSSKIEQRKLELFRCPKCKIYIQWFSGDDVYICPVCAYEYEIENSCPDCGAKVSSDTTKCPNCGKLREDCREEDMYVTCLNCETGLEGFQEENIFSCLGCGIEYISMRACPSCLTEITPETTSCPECSKKLSELEGEYLYPMCPEHKIPMDYSTENSFFCLRCIPDPDDEEDDDDIEDCPECGAEVTDEDSVCPECGCDLFEDD